jgi:biotin-dependent enzyme
MKGSVLEARVERAAEDRLRVLAPALGIWAHELEPGITIGTGSRLGKLTVLGKSHVLVLPEAPAGRIASGLPPDRRVAVDHGQVLFELDLLEAGETTGPSVARPVPEGVAVVSPTDGVFYRAPSPGAPTFVEVGDRVREGQAVGLVEVMKTFNHILYGGSSLPQEAVVVEICCGDRQEIRAGQTLMLVRPATGAP